MLTNRRTIKADEIMAIAQALGVYPNDLYGIESEKEVG